MNNVPFFEVNGQRFEIKRTRYIQAEFDKLKREISMSEEEEKQYAKEQEIIARMEKLSTRKEDLYDIYLETFAEEDLDKFKKAEQAYELLSEQLSKMPNITGKQRKKFIDMVEGVIIRSLQLDDKGEEIRGYETAKEIWENFVVENGEVVAIEFISYTANYILGIDGGEEENPFLTQAKARAEQRAQKRREGLKKAR